MAQQIITKVGKAQFQTSWEGVQNSLINMDFNPIINQFGLEGNFILLHWQALPRNYRRFGFYASDKDWYYAFDYQDLEVQGKLDLRPIQIDERKFRTKPTAVLYAKISRSYVKDGKTGIIVDDR